MKKVGVAAVCVFLCMASIAEEFRTWKDRNGNTLEARLIYKSEKKIELRDRQGNIHSIDPQKLCDEDQRYLSPPQPAAPPAEQYDLSLLRRQTQVQNSINPRNKYSTETYNYQCTLNVKFLSDDDAHVSREGLRGALFIVGSEPDEVLVVLGKTEAPVEMVSTGEGCVTMEEFTVTQTMDEDRQWIEGTKYDGYLLVLYAADGSVLKTRSAPGFLGDNLEKTLSLNVGDRFNEQCELLPAEEPHEEGFNFQKALDL